MGLTVSRTGRQRLEVARVGWRRRGDGWTTTGSSMSRQGGGVEAAGASSEAGDMGGSGADVGGGEKATATAIRDGGVVGPLLSSIQIEGRGGRGGEWTERGEVGKGSG